MAKNSTRIALLQLSTGCDKSENIKNAIQKISDAKRKGASLVVLPECFNSPYGNQYFGEYAEPIPKGETCQALSKAAKDNNIFLVGGSIPEREGSKMYNTCTVWDPQGNLVGKFRKIHLYDLEVPRALNFKESNSLTPGDSLCVVDIGPCKIGVALCWDMRFNELATLYRNQGVDILLYPGAFDMVLGQLHWELLLKSRALDNQIFTAGVCGARDPSAHYVAWGHSMVVNPWGEVIAQAEFDENIVIADIDCNECTEIRKQMPLKTQRRTDIYDTIAKIGTNK